MNPLAALAEKYMIRSWEQRRSWVAGVLCCCLVVYAIAPSLRYPLLFNIVPLTILALSLVLLMDRFAILRSKRAHVALVLLIGLLLHWYSFFRVGVLAAFDSREFLHHGQTFAHGGGLTVLYRPPLYPLLVGLAAVVGDSTGILTVGWQRVLAICSSVLVYWLCLRFDWRPATALLCSILFALNSLAMQTCTYVMTETLFIFLALLSIVVFIRFHDEGRIAWAIGAGACVAVTQHLRQLLVPLFLIALALTIVKWKRRAVVPCLVAVACCWLLMLPWSLRNLHEHGQFGLSAHFGANVYSKARSYGLENENGPLYSRVAPILDNVYRDLDLRKDSIPPVPPDDWMSNLAVHSLTDSLVENHGYSYAEASTLLAAVARESFLHNPKRSIQSVMSSFAAFMFHHHDMFPDVSHVIPVPYVLLRAQYVKRFLRGFVYISGSLFLLFPLFAAYRCRLTGWIPFGVVILMYALTAAVQIGRTRFVVPWVPFRVMCGGFVVYHLAYEARRWSIKVLRALSR